MAGVSIAAALTATESGRITMATQCHNVPGGIWGAAFGLLLDPTECSAVRQQVTLAFCCNSFIHSLSLSVLMALQYLAEISLLARRGITLQLASFWQRLLILKHEACWWAAYRPCQHTSVSLAKQHSFFTGRMPFLSPNQQCQSTEGKI